MLQTTTAYRVDTSRGESRGDLSRQWIARPADQRFLSLSELRDSVAARASVTAEDRVQNRDLELFAPEVNNRDELHRLFAALPNGRVLNMTHWSFGQLAQLAGAPAGYLRTLPSPIVADAVTYGLRYNRNAEQIKTYATAAELLAVTGPEYGRIYDHEVVSAVMQVAGNGVGDTRWKVPGTLNWATSTYDPETPVSPDTTTLYASDRDVFIFLVDDRNPIEIGKLKDGSPDLVFRGFYISNSEVGGAALKLAAFYLRAVCCNRIMWGVEGFQEITLRHTKMAPSRFVEMARPALQSFAEGSTSRLLEGVQKAKAAKVAEDQDSAVEFLRSRNVSRRRSLEILEAAEREEGHPPRSAWDIAQGITATARNIRNADDRVELETVARRVLDRVA